jgi:hypothetical protein
MNYLRFSSRNLQLPVQEEMETSAAELVVRPAEK